MFPCSTLLQHTAPDKDEIGCLLSERHSRGKHLTYLKYRGFTLWENNWNCGCDTDEDDCGCAISQSVSLEEALDMLLRSYGEASNFPEEVKKTLEQHEENPAPFQKE